MAYRGGGQGGAIAPGRRREGGAAGAPRLSYNRAHSVGVPLPQAPPSSGAPFLKRPIPQAPPSAGASFRTWFAVGRRRRPTANPVA